MAGGGGPGPGRRRWRRPCTTEGGVRGAPTARHPQSPATRRPARRCAPAEFSRGPVPAGRKAQSSKRKKGGGAGSATHAPTVTRVPEPRTCAHGVTRGAKHGHQRPQQTRRVALQPDAHRPPPRTSPVHKHINTGWKLKTGARAPTGAHEASDTHSTTPGADTD